MLKLYAHPASPYALRVQLFLAEIGLSYQYITVALETGEHRRKPFKALNPLQRVPVLDHDGFILAESHAILRYLCAREACWHWYPAPLQERAMVDQWMDYAGFQVGIPITKLGWERFWQPKFKRQPDALAVEEALTKMRRELPLVEARLQVSRYLAAQTPTLADISFLPMLYYAELAGFSLAPYPYLEAWYQTMASRTSWQGILQSLKI